VKMYKKTGKMVALLIIVMLVATGVLSGCSQEEKPLGSGEKTIKDEVVAILSIEPVNLDPQVSNMLAAYATEKMIFDTLVVKDDNGEIKPSLAKRWEKIDDTTMRFYLRDDVYFHNGKKFTSKDVVYTIKRCTEEPVTASTFKAFDGKNTVAVDEYTVDIKLLQPFAPILNYLTYARAFIVSKETVEEIGKDKYGREPIGTGPFKLVEWNTGTNIILESTEKFWGEAPSFSKLNLKFITEPTNRTIELETGSADIVFDVSINDAKRIDENKDLVLVKGPSYKTSFIAFNLNKELIQNVKIRQALSLAINVEEMADAVYGGYVTPADSPMSPSIFGYASIRKHVYDPEKAKQLLAEAGYPNGLVLEGRTQQNSDFRSIAEIAQNMWRQIGVTANIQIVDKATYAELGKNNGGVEITVTSQTATTGDPDHALYTWHSSLQSGIFNSHDEHLDSLINQGAKTYDNSQRLGFYKEAQQYIMDSYYGIPVAFPDVIYGISKNVENFFCDPGNIPNLSRITVYSK